MREFLNLLITICFIALSGMMFDAIFPKNDKPLLNFLITVVSYAASLGFVIRFVMDNCLNELADVFRTIL